MIKHEIKTITIPEFKKRMDSTSNLFLVDVREQEEWDSMRIPGALHMPKEMITSLIAEQTIDKTHPVYLYCHGGVRSLYAAQYLMDVGYEDVYSIDGGIMDWIVQGHPVET